MRFLLPLLFVLPFAVGCKKSPEAKANEQIVAMNGVTVVLEEIKDDQSAAAALPRLELACGQLRAVKQAADRDMKRDAERNNGRMPTKEEWDAAIQTANKVMKPIMDAMMKRTGASMKAQMAAPQHATRIAALTNFGDGSDPR